jgi:nucleoside-diphosphate-sugar epimerase
MRVFLAGATGAIGRRLVPRLVARGHDVTATTTSRDKLEQLRRLGADPVVVDGLDAAAVGEAVARAEPEAVVHQMSALAGEPDLRRWDRWFARTNELRTKGTENLLAAARASGATRFVAQSFTGWPNTREGGPVKTEDDPLDSAPPAAQSESLAAIRFLERAVLEAPLTGVVLRYGNLYGPGASEGLVELIRARKLPILGGGGGIWSWIHVDDAASGTVAALEHSVPGVYNIVDDEPAPASEWLPYLAEQVGAKQPLRLPAWLGRIAAGEVAVSLMTRIRGSSNAKARRELGWEPSWRSWREGFRDGLTDEPAAGQSAATRAA